MISNINDALKECQKLIELDKDVGNYYLKKLEALSSIDKDKEDTPTDGCRFKEGDEVYAYKNEEGRHSRFTKERLLLNQKYTLSKDCLHTDEWLNLEERTFSHYEPTDFKLWSERDFDLDSDRSVDVSKLSKDGGLIDMGLPKYKEGDWVCIKGHLEWICLVGKPVSLESSIPYKMDKSVCMLDGDRYENSTTFKNVERLATQEEILWAKHCLEGNKISFEDWRKDVWGTGSSYQIPVRKSEKIDPMIAMKKWQEFSSKVLHHHIHDATRVSTMAVEGIKQRYPMAGEEKKPDNHLIDIPKLYVPKKQVN